MRHKVIDAYLLNKLKGLKLYSVCSNIALNSPDWYERRGLAGAA